MKVIDTYSKGGYIYFVLDDNTETSYPAYWALSPFTSAGAHKELQALLIQVKEKICFCKNCWKEIKMQFPPRDIDIRCNLCQSQYDFDCQILKDIFNKMGVW